MKPRRQASARPSPSTVQNLAGLALYILLAALLLLLAISMVTTYRIRNRGVEAATGTGSTASPWGVNVALEQYTPDELQAVLAMIHGAGFRWIRQEFPWDAIEPEPGQYSWQPWDDLVRLASENGLSVIAVLDRSPAWARASENEDNPAAPPADLSQFAAWSGAFAAHYGAAIKAYQVWDGPNIAPNWGAGDVDPLAYARMLAMAYGAIKEVAPEAIVVSAALAPTTEPGGRNMSELTYLSLMYDAGAAASFDVLGAKPYGFWSGPEDRRVDPMALDFSRVILLREEMLRRGDGDKPVWAVEMGWNALPTGWQGNPSPWGSDSEEKQADRTLRAFTRARAEWPWLGLIALPAFQPNAPPNDPVWGFSLVDSDFQPRLLLRKVSAFIASPASAPAPYVPPRRRLAAALLVLAVGVAVVGWRGVVHLRRLPLLQWSQQASAAYLSWPDWAQALTLGGAVCALIASPWDSVALLALWFVLALTYVKLEWTLLYAILLLPFTPFHRLFWGLSFSWIEILTLVAIGAWALQVISRYRQAQGGPIAQLKRFLGTIDWRGMDGAWCFFVAVAIISLAFSRYVDVSLRELRVIVLEPALFYVFLTRYPFASRRGRLKPYWRALIDALVLVGGFLALQGLVQYVAGGDLIVTEGVRRIRGIYGSPNNLSLVLGRILPVAVAVALWGKTRLRRWLYGGAALLMVACIFLTFSRGAWILGVPAALLFLGLMRGRRAALITVGAVTAGVLLLIPLAGTERIASLLNLETGTSFFRLALWKATVAMIRDHLITGVGLDNFLYYYQHYILAEAAAEPYLSHPHNILLDFWVRLGLGGLAALFWLLIAFFRRGVSLWKRLPEGDMRAIALGLMAGVVNMVAHGMVDNSYFVIELAFIFALATGWVRRLTAIKEADL